MISLVFLGTLGKICHLFCALSPHEYYKYYNINGMDIHILKALMNLIRLISYIS